MEPVGRGRATAAVGDSRPVRVRLRRTRGWRLPENTKVVSRPSKWGNPFTVAEFGPEGAVSQYIQHLRRHPELVRAAREELRGLNLACWCRENAPCHADALLQVANA